MKVWHTLEVPYHLWTVGWICKDMSEGWQDHLFTKLVASLYICHAISIDKKECVLRSSFSGSGCQMKYDGRLRLLAIEQAEFSVKFLFFRVDFGQVIVEILIKNDKKLGKKLFFSTNQGLWRPNGIRWKAAVARNQTSRRFREFSFF